MYISSYLERCKCCTSFQKSKVMEKVVYKKIYKYLGDNNLLTDKKSGFKHSDSTVNQLLFITQKIANALDDKHDACIVFLDVS